MDVLRKDVRPSALITRASLENAIACVAATGGSTNAVLHFLAVAREAGVELEIDDFDRVAASTPPLGDLKPSGRFLATDLYRAGGVALVARRLLDAGLLNADTPPSAVARSVTRPPRPRKPPVRRSFARSPIPFRRAVASRSCAAISPPTVAC